MLKYPWWNEAQCKLADEAKEFTDQIMGEVAEIVWRKRYPWGILRQIGEKGWFGALVPKQYCGRCKG